MDKNFVNLCKKLHKIVRNIYLYYNKYKEKTVEKRDNMKWEIGNVKIKNQVVLAPMAGTSNPAYIKICEEMDLGYAITELISSEAIIRDNKKTLDMLEGYDKLNIPVAIQLFGSNIETMKKAAKIIEDKYKPKIIDINMGCPVPKVANRALAGSALLKDPEKVYALVKAVCQSVNIPVTVKIRSGWDQQSINAKEIAKIVEKAGAKAIAIHARTKSQGYTGKADWSIIKSVKESVNIPVIGNGDVKSKEDAKKMIEETGCDAIMIGRSALGNPWIIKQTVDYLDGKNLEKTPTNKEKIEMLKKHLNYLLETKKESLAIREMRTQSAYYLKGMPNSSEVKPQLFKALSKRDFTLILDKYLENLKHL